MTWGSVEMDFRGTVCTFILHFKAFTFIWEEEVEPEPFLLFNSTWLKNVCTFDTARKQQYKIVFTECNTNWMVIAIKIKYGQKRAPPT